MNKLTIALYLPGAPEFNPGGERPIAKATAKFRQYDRDNKPTTGTLQLVGFGGQAEALRLVPAQSSVIVTGRLKPRVEETPGGGKRRYMELIVQSVATVEKLTALDAPRQPKPAAQPKPPAPAPAPQPAKAAAQSMAAAFGGETLDYEEIPF